MARTFTKEEWLSSYDAIYDLVNQDGSVVITDEGKEDLVVINAKAYKQLVKKVVDIQKTEEKPVVEEVPQPEEEQVDEDTLNRIRQTLTAFTDEDSGNAIAIEDLSKSYNKLKVVNQATFNVPYHSVYSIIGPNKSGKTTLLRMISGLAPNKHGSMTLLNKKDQAEKERLHIGSYIGEGDLLDDMSLKDNLKMRAKIGAIKQSKKAIKEILDLLDISNLSKRKVNTLSAGERKLAHIAMAMLGYPDVILLDEPYTGLDANTIKHVNSVILKAHEAGSTIVITSTMLDPLLDVSSHYSTMNKGQLSAPITAKEVVDKGIDLVKMMKGVAL